MINDWRASIDLEPVPATEGPCLAETLKVPFTYCWSPSLVPKPIDWPAHIDVCGFFFRSPPSFTPPPDIDEFLRSGPPPVYIGFGSIVIDNPPAMTATLLSAVQALGIRAIISRGWSNLGTEQTNDQVFFLGDCPLEWLFQRVSAVVHHGGAGTTACGLRNGKPTVIIPFFGEYVYDSLDLTSICFMLIRRSQLFWGTMVASHGLGPAPISHRDLNAQNLTQAIRFCLQPEALAAAQKVALEMSEEAGVTAAVASFHRNLPAEHMRCHLIPSEPAAWKFKKAANPPMYLSKLAAGILVDYLRVESKHLDPYGLVLLYTSPCKCVWLTDITEQVRVLSDPDQKSTMGPRHRHHLLLTRHQQRCNQGHTRHFPPPIPGIHPRLAITIQPQPARVLNPPLPQHHLIKRCIIPPLRIQQEIRYSAKYRRRTRRLCKECRQSCRLLLQGHARGHAIGRERRPESRPAAVRRRGRRPRSYSRLEVRDDFCREELHARHERGLLWCFHPAL